MADLANQGLGGDGAFDVVDGTCMKPDVECLAAVEEFVKYRVPGL
jgi:hypothetical protein